MKLIISPAKKMNVDTDTLAPLGEPVLLEKTEALLSRMRELSYEEAKALWGCNEKLARQNFERFQDMELRRGLTPAILSYEGIQYQYMAPAVFEERMLAWVQEHLRDPVRLLRGLKAHGRGDALPPGDAGPPFCGRGAGPLCVLGRESLGGDLRGGCGRRGRRSSAAAALREESGRVVLNLASKEYSRCIEKYLRPEDRFITCIFGEWSGGKIVQKGTYAKMARGEMVRFLAERQAERPEEARDFDRLGYRFAPEHSDEKSYVFVRMV